MLAAPLKVAKELNWEKPLNDYIRSQYGGDNVAIEYAADIQRLNNARKRATQVNVPDEASIEAVKKYISLLNTVGLRFPSLKGGEGKSEWKNLSFSWTDAFRPKNSVSQTDIEFERACMMFNLGALESLAGIQHDMKTAEGLKAACANFARAAGVFACLERGMNVDEAAPARLTGTLTSDLSPEGLGMLKNLMLAQAQYCFFERASMDEMKPGILAKVSAQVTKFYDASLGFARNPALAKVLDPAWANHIEFHKRKNESWCAYYHAQSVLKKATDTGDGYGELVAWLRKAESVARSAWEWAGKRGLPGGVILPVKTLLDKVQGDLYTADNDNAKIYFQAVPDPASLPAIEGHVLAKANPVEERLLKITATDDPIFKNLLIPWMRQAEESFRTKVSGLLKAYGDKVTSRTNEVRQGLADAGLPASVEGVGSEKGLPEGLWKRISEQVLARGGVAALEADAAENKRSNEFLSQKIKELEQDLQAERDSDEATRTQFSSAFTAQPSRQLNQNMMTDLGHYRSLLLQAKRSDEALPDQFRANSQYLTLLTRSREELTAYLPDAEVAVQSDPNVDKVRNELMLLLVDLGAKVQDCENAQTVFVEAASDASIVSELERADRLKATEIVQHALDNFQPFIQEVDSKLSSISAKFSAVLEKNHSFAALRTQNEASKKREKALAALDTAILKFNELHGLVKEGARFYSDIGTQVEQARVVIQDYCFVRNVEREEFVQSRGGTRAPSASIVDAPTAPILTAPVTSERPQSFASSSIPIARPAPHRPAPPPPVAAATSGGAHPFRQNLDLMKSTLGLDDAPDSLLEPYLKAANNDLNQAIDNYFQNPPATATTNTPQPQAKPKGSRGGWFQ